MAATWCAGRTFCFKGGSVHMANRWRVSTIEGVRAGDGGVFVTHPNPTLSHSLTHTHFHTLTHTHSHALSRSHSHAHTHTHTLTRSHCRPSRTVGGTKGGGSAPLKSGDLKGGEPRRLGGAEGWGLKIPRFFSFSHPNVHVFLLSGCMFVEFWWCF